MRAAPRSPAKAFPNKSSWRRRGIVAVVLLCATLALLSVARMPGGPLFVPRQRVLIIGAGASGLSAAVALSGYATVLMLEAQERLGGRVWTNHSLGVPVCCQ